VADDRGMDRPTPDAIAELIPWIEARLDDALTLDRIAQQAGLSPYHFSRLFTARMGRSVMAYVRGRRLVRGARRLCDEPELQLVELALDCGFESQEAFTRAFKRIFGVSPGRFRAGFALTPIEGQYPMNLPASTSTAVTRLPDLVRLEAFSIAGPARRFDQESRSEIPQLWSALIGALPFEGQVPSWATYGAVWGVDREEGSFDYMAGVGIVPGSALPAGFSEKRIPAATYAVFRITLDGSALHPQVKNAMATIWGQLIPASGLKLADSPDFELYDGKFEPTRPGAVIDFHVPVEG
jgi:AraC family transcriptional regulator